MTKKLLIIGKPNSSKSTFITQFYTRLVKNKSKLKLFKPVDNIIPIKEPRERLSMGLEVESTATGKNVELMLPIQYDDQKIDLTCPDYAGEQINNIISTREVNEKWEKSIKQSDNWILFIRIGNLKTVYDLSNKTVDKQILEQTKNEKSGEYEISDQSAFIELLQIILHIKGYDSHFENSTIKLTVVLTCWDELKTKENPRDILSVHLPLLLNFIETNWDNNNVNFIGLSAQGFNLDNPKNKERYETEGSENFGYLIKSDGSRTYDLTQLISEAL